MEFVIGKFRANFPEFVDTTKYPDSMIQFWAELAEIQVRQSIWKNAWVKGVSLYVAHEITLATQNIKANAVGGSPGQQGGIANSKTVGSATVSYDSQTSSEKDAGFWNLTIYGKQFYRLAQVFGAGGIQL